MLYCRFGSKDSILWHNLADVRQEIVNFSIMKAKTILITGATSGIGEACARRFAGEGRRLILNGRNTEKLAALRRELVARGSEVQSMKIAASNPLCVLRRRGVEENYTLHYELEDALTAPVSKGETIGYAVLLRDGVEVMRTDLVACGEAQRFTWWEAYRENARHWNIV